MPETQTCPVCGRTWEYTPTKSTCPRCGVKVVEGGVVQRAVPAPRAHAEIEHEFSSLRNKLKGGTK
ncbi:unnamed protein product [marine sediment metagenome]|uniref:Uncharacterized protein n=1 Tax=marine sediment metagenome TaxID=412755 RepID=X1F106_9ZZZZ